MDSIKDCPLSIEVADMVELAEKCGKPVMLLDKEKRLIAKNDAVEGEAFFIKFGVSAKRFMSDEAFSVLDTLKTGCVGKVKLGLDGGTEAEVALFDDFYYAELTQNLTVRYDKEQFAKDYTDALISCKQIIETDRPQLPRSRREQAGETARPKDETSRLRHLSVQRVLEINGECQNSEPAEPHSFFDPSELILGMCNTAEAELAGRGIRLKDKIEPATYLCYDNYKKLRSALLTLMSVGIENTVNQRLYVEGNVVGGRYKLCVSFKCPTDDKVSSDDLRSWATLLGEHFEDIVDISGRRFWLFKIGKYAGDTVRLFLYIPLTHKKSFSFLYPAIPSACYEETVLKRISEIKWQ